MMRFFSRVSSPSRGNAATFLRSYLVGGVLVLLVGFVLYSQWILHRLEENNEALVLQLARLTSYLPSIDDRETSQLIQDVVKSVTQHTRVRFIITDAKGVPLIARGIDPSLEEKLDAGQPLSVEESDVLYRALARMKKAHRAPIQTEYVSEDRRIIGRIYYGDVDPSELADLPLVLADVNGNPIAWRIYGGWQTIETAPQNRRRAEALIRDAERRNRVTEVQINPPIQTGSFYYALQPLYALEWMPYVQIVLVVGFVAGGILLYRRIRTDEQAAIWAGLAKESAHQLGTPISSLMGWIDLAEEAKPRDATDAAVPDVYEEMHRDIARLQRIVRRFSQVGQTPVRRPVIVNDVAAEAVDYFRKRLPTRSADIDLQEAYADVPPVLANEDLLQWVIENLIRNAIDAIESTSDGRGWIRLSTDYDVARNYVTLVVEDNGGGIPRKVRRRIFAPGFSTKKHGWGVGLTLAKRIVESYHDGQLRLVATDAAGTTFEVRLPGAAGETRGKAEATKRSRARQAR